MLNKQTTGTIIDVTNSWGSEHIGEVWWNLTNAKFYNPYQGDIIYSTQNLEQSIPRK